MPRLLASVLLVVALVAAAHQAFASPPIPECQQSELYRRALQDRPYVGFNLGTKTPYYPQQNASSYTPPPQGCFPVHINLVARHGARDPTNGDIAALLQLQAAIEANKDKITNAAYAWMKNWTSPYVPQDAGYLVLPGEEEHYNLAQRMRGFYNTVLNESYEPSRYPMRSTQVSRTGRSANSYGFGLFEGKGTFSDCKFDPFFVISYNKDTDDVLRFFDMCHKYEDQVLNNPKATEEATLYEHKVLPDIASRVSQKLGNWNVTTAETSAMWTACSFEYSICGKSDGFCSLFEREDIDMLAYLDDLESYYEKGYGHAIDYTIACPLLDDMVVAIDQVTAAPVDTHSQRANLRFAHAETVMPFVALLGLFKDQQPLSANASAEVIANRLWKGSLISPFTANVALVLYNCSAAAALPVNDANDDSRYNVKVLVNEKEQTLPGCDGQLYCPLDKFKQIYAGPLSHCDLDAMCDNPSPCGDGDGDGSGEEGDKWSIKKARGIVALVVVGLAGLVLGMMAMGGVFVYLRYKRRSVDIDYELLRTDKIFS